MGLRIVVTWTSAALRAHGRAVAHHRPEQRRRRPDRARRARRRTACSRSCVTSPPISSDEDQHADVAARAGHAGHGRHLVALEQVGRHRDHGDRQRLVREAAEAEQRDRDVGALDEPDERRRRSSCSAPTVNAPRRALIRRMPRFCSAMTDRAAEHAAEIGGEERQPGEQRDLLQIEVPRRSSDTAAARRSACPTWDRRESAAARCPRNCAAGGSSQIDGRVPSPRRCASCPDRM